MTLVVALVWCFAQLPAPTPDPAPVIYDYREPERPLARAHPPQRQPAPKVSGVAPQVTGYATRYAYHEGQAAAGPALRKALGKDWRGQTVDVCKGEACVSVKLTDWCACGDRHGRDTVIDLDNRDFAKLAPLGDGITIVGVTR